MSSSKTFLKIIIPLSRVSIFSGLFLVVMEVLNEYGAVKYFGVNTLLVVFLDLGIQCRMFKQHPY